MPAVREFGKMKVARMMKYTGREEFFVELRKKMKKPLPSAPVVRLEKPQPETQMWLGHQKLAKHGQ